MGEQPMDPEMKALLEGIEVPDEDVEVIREIGASKGAPKSLAEAAAAVEDWTNTGPLQDRKYSTDERPPDAVFRRRTSTTVLGMLVVALVAIVGYRVTRPPPPIVVGDPLDFVTVMAPLAAAGPAMEPEWSIPRGASDSLSERGRAVRVGSLLVEFERANLRGDSTAQVFADAVSALVSDVPDGGVDVAAVFASGGDGARSAEARHALAPFVRAAPMALGGWVQAARVAALAGDAGFFASQQSRGAVLQLVALKGLTPEAEAVCDRLDTLLHRRGRPDFSAVSAALEVVQRELAN